MTSAPTTAATAAPNDFADALIGSFERAGYARVEPAILQPAEPFLDLSGEDIRKRMYLTTDPQGRELCLRPDLTIPVSRDYLASPAAGKPRGFCYLGPVFRHRAEGGGEFMQAGIESFGRPDTAAADAEMLALGLGAQTSLPRETRALIEKFLAIAGDPGQAAAKLRAFAREGKIALDAALDAFESRTACLAARGVDVARIRFSTAFGRGLDYYTGFVFELHDPLARALGPLVAGGRYDGLLTRLGSARAIAAVGFAVWIERLAALRSTS